MALFFERRHMKRSVREALIFLSGGLLGGAAGVYGTYKYFFARADKEINDMQNYYERKLDDLKEMQDQINLTKDIDEEKKPSVVTEDLDKEELEEYSEMIDKLKYNKISTKPKKKAKKEIDISNQPKIISYDEYSEDNNYEKVVVSYFEDDGTLMLEDESLFEDGINVLGPMNLEHFGMMDDDPEPDTIYIRNEALGVDYEVVREDGSYENFLANNGY